MLLTFDYCFKVNSMSICVCVYSCVSTAQTALQRSGVWGVCVCGGRLVPGLPGHPWLQHQPLHGRGALRPLGGPLGLRLLAAAQWLQLHPVAGARLPPHRGPGGLPLRAGQHPEDRREAGAALQHHRRYGVCVCVCVCVCDLGERKGEVNEWIWERRRVSLVNPVFLYLHLSAHLCTMTADVKS